MHLSPEASLIRSSVLTPLSISGLFPKIWLEFLFKGSKLHNFMNGRSKN